MIWDQSAVAKAMAGHSFARFAFPGGLPPEARRAKGGALSRTRTGTDISGREILSGMQTIGLPAVNWAFGFLVLPTFHGLHSIWACFLKTNQFV